MHKQGDACTVSYQLLDRRMNADPNVGSYDAENNIVFQLAIDQLDLDVRLTNRLKRGGIFVIGDLVQKKEKELLVFHKIGLNSLDKIKHSLGLRNLYLDSKLINWPPVHNKIHRAVSLESDCRDTKIEYKEANTFKEELAFITKSILSDKAKDGNCLLAHYGWDRDKHVTLQEIANNGLQYGLDRNVTRERIRQKVKKAVVCIKRSQEHVCFHKWVSALEQAIKCSVMLESEFARLFGFHESKPGESFKAIQRVADVFDLGFPFNAYDDKGRWVVYDETIGPLHTIRKKIFRPAVGTPYVTLQEMEEEIDCPQSAIISIIESSQHLEFLDDKKEFYWKRPVLPPKNYGKTGNRVLTQLCKIFSVANKSLVADLHKALKRARLLKFNVPVSAIQGIAKLSGLFEVNGDVVNRKPRHQWCALTPRDIDLLKVACEHGQRVLSSKQLHESLLSRKFSPTHARVMVQSSPFIIPTVRGLWAREGLYKFIPTLDEINVSILKYSNRGSDIAPSSNQSHRNLHDEESVISFLIDSRVSMSGKFVQDKKFKYMGTWNVVDSNGEKFGEVYIEGRVISGLKPIINDLGLVRGDHMRICIECVNKKTLCVLF